MGLNLLRISGALSALLLAVQAWAFSPFVIKEIRADGLERLEIGTVLTYLPLNVGDDGPTRSGLQS